HFHQGRQRFVTGADFAEYVIDAFDCLWREGAHAPKMMSIGLHLRMIGRPGRIAALDRIVAHMNGKGGAWFATRRQIAEHWLARF
ncbi:MAG: chitin deacetylase, partial [Reyranella sp.]